MFNTGFGPGLCGTQLNQHRINIQRMAAAQQAAQMVSEQWLRDQIASDPIIQAATQEAKVDTTKTYDQGRDDGYKVGRAYEKERAEEDAKRERERAERRRKDAAFFRRFLFCVAVYVIGGFWTFAHVNERYLSVRESPVSLFAGAGWPIYWAGTGAITAHRAIFKKEPVQ